MKLNFSTLLLLSARAFKLSPNKLCYDLKHYLELPLSFNIMRININTKETSSPLYILALIKFPVNNLIIFIFKLIFLSLLNLETHNSMLNNTRGERSEETYRSYVYELRRRVRPLGTILATKKRELLHSLFYSYLFSPSLGDKIGCISTPIFFLIKLKYI